MAYGEASVQANAAGPVHIDMVRAASGDGVDDVSPSGVPRDPTADGVDDAALPGSHPPAKAVTPAQLHERHYPAMVRTAALMVDDRFLAEEIVQDAFAALIARWDSLDPDKAVAYLYRAVANGAKSMLRRRRTARRHDSGLRVGERSVDQLSSGQAAGEPGADAAVLRAAGLRCC